MARLSANTRLTTVLDLLDINASRLSRFSGVDHSLITKWQRGERPLTKRSKMLRVMVAAIVDYDKDGALSDLLSPYRQQGEDAATALCEYLTGKDLPALAPRADAPKRQTSGEYTVQYQVYLGRRGLRQAVLAMLDYVQVIPPGRELITLSHGRYDWVTQNLPFLVQVLGRLNKAIERGTKITVINRKGYSIADTSAFAGPWLAAHLKGYIRSRYYEGDLPPGDKFLASIPGYWSLRVREDAEVEDSIFITMHTDMLDIKGDEDTCDRYLQLSKPASQYNFLESPQGVGEDVKMWQPGPLPLWPEGGAPDGSFHLISRLPGFGLCTWEEYAQIAKGGGPEIPDYAFSSGGPLPAGRYRVILCRDDICEAMGKQRHLHEPFSALLHRKAYLPHTILSAQIRRILAEMDANPDFEVALVPRVAFEELQVEMICWKDSASICWLPGVEQSAFANEKCTSGSFYGFVEHAWDKLLTGWKRQDRVKRQLRKWLAGKELDGGEPDSAMVRNWSLLPKP